MTTTAFLWSVMFREDTSGDGMRSPARLRRIHAQRGKTMLRVLTAVVLTAGFYGLARADAQPPADSQVTKFVGTLQQLADGGLLLKGIVLTEAKVVPDASGTGLNLQLRAHGGTRQQRSLLPVLVRLAMNDDPEWQVWQRGNRFAILYDDDPAEAGQQPVSPDPRPQSDFEPPPPAEDRQAQLRDEADRLRNRVQDRIEISPGMTGIVLTDPAVEDDPNGGGRVVMLRGRLMSDAQREPLHELLQDTADGIPFWRDQYDGVTFSVDEVEVVSPSLQRGSRYVSLGIEYFRECRLDEAADAFSRALAENPGNRVLLYWRTLVHLALGESDRAEAKLRYLLRNYPAGQADPVIAVALESVQGPLRGQLIQMERDILLDRTAQYTDGAETASPLEPADRPRPPAPGISPPPPASPPGAPPETSPQPPVDRPASSPPVSNGTAPPPAAPPAVPPSAVDNVDEAPRPAVPPGDSPAPPQPAPPADPAPPEDAPPAADSPAATAPGE
ncbi:MAG: hypothetical protein KDA79_21110 [Planctomycetaceae bacterium]|nr:hypothetical protein [Planctomycetaceae bacterium]